MRILGIDLGNTSVKAVEIESGFGGYQIHEYHEQKVQDGETASEALARIILSLPKRPDRIAVALRTSQVTFRNLQLPAPDRKALQSAINFELEDDLPFPLEQSSYDFAILSQTRQGAHVHVSVTLQRYMDSLLSQLAAAGVDPDLVTSEAWAYRALLNRSVSPMDQEKPVLLIQLGHQNTTLYLHWRGCPVSIREVRWGGVDLDTAICRKYGVTLEQAQAAKIDRGFVLPPSQRDQASPEQIEFSDAIVEAMTPLLQELRHEQLTCKSITQELLSSVYLTGGTSLFPGLVSFLDEHLKVPTRPLRALSSSSTSGVTYSDHADAHFALAAALGLCFLGPERGVIINLRKGKYAKQGQARQLNWAVIKKPLIATTVIISSLIISLVLQSQIYQSRITETNTKLEKGIQAFFTELNGSSLSQSRLRALMGNTSTLQKTIDTEVRKQTEIAKLMGPNQHSPLSFLRSLSSRIQKSIPVDMLQYQVGAATSSKYAPADMGTVKLTFLVATSQQVEQLSSSLTPLLSELKQSPPEETKAADGSSRLKVTFTGKPTEAAYGK